MYLFELIRQHTYRYITWMCLNYPDDILWIKVLFYSLTQFGLWPIVLLFPSYNNFWLPIFYDMFLHLWLTDWLTDGRTDRHKSDPMSVSFSSSDVQDPKKGRLLVLCFLEIYSHVILQSSFRQVLEFFFQTIHFPSNHTALNVRLVLYNCDVRGERLLVPRIQVCGQGLEVVRIEPPFPGGEVLEHLQTDRDSVLDPHHTGKDDNFQQS